MGMYTELVLTARIKNDPAVVNVLKYMLEADPYPPYTEQPASLPDHPLFRTDRWHFMLKCSSYYFVPRAMHLFEYDEIGGYWVLISRSDFKNYNNEVALFIDWLRPHLADDGHGDMFGYSRYEEDREPIIYYDDKDDEAPNYLKIVGSIPIPSKLEE